MLVSNISQSCRFALSLYLSSLYCISLDLVSSKYLLKKVSAVTQSCVQLFITVSMWKLSVACKEEHFYFRGKFILNSNFFLIFLELDLDLEKLKAHADLHMLCVENELLLIE